MGTVQSGEVSDADLLHYAISQLTAEVAALRQQMATLTTMVYQQGTKSSAALDRIWRGLPDGS